MTLNKDQAAVVSEFTLDLAKAVFISGVLQQTLYVSSSFLLRSMYTLGTLITSMIFLFIAVKFREKGVYDE